MGEHPCLAPECERVFKSPKSMKGYLLSHLCDDDLLELAKQIPKEDSREKREREAKTITMTQEEMAEALKDFSTKPHQRPIRPHPGTIRRKFLENS